MSAKPDVLCYLLALDGQGATSREIARAVGYADRNVRQAARDLALGGFVEERETYPVEYAARAGFALSLVRLLSREHRRSEGVPRWIDWWAIYAFLLRIASWAEDPTLEKPYLLSSSARELFGEYRWALRAPDLRLPDPNRYPGEQYLGAFSETVDIVTEWIGKRV